MPHNIAPACLPPLPTNYKKGNDQEGSFFITTWTWLEMNRAPTGGANCKVGSSRGRTQGQGGAAFWWPPLPGVDPLGGPQEEKGGLLTFTTQNYRLTKYGVGVGNETINYHLVIDF